MFAPARSRPMGVLFSTFLLAALVCLGLVAGAPGQTPEVVRSLRSGNWSDARTWSGGEVPGQGERVQIRVGHRVVYDQESEVAIRAIHVAGTLTFATDRSTRLDVGLIRIEAGDEWKDGGFDCHRVPVQPDEESSRPALLIGTPERPIPAGMKALVRLVPFEGDDTESLPAIVCCSGRMEIHGAPLRRTWLKLERAVAPHESRILLPEEATDWKKGDRIVVSATSRQRPFAGNVTAHVTQASTSEERKIRRIKSYDRSIGGDDKVRSLLIVDRRFERAHRADPGFAAEVANLSRNVVIESAEPEGHRGHTMYHRFSQGSVSYAEFRHLGKKGVLGRYPIHYHLVGDTMRGSSVVGASVWDSHNRWITIHGTQYLVVRDCVGYRSVGHGYFMEDGTEVFNVLDRNLALQALVGRPLPEQVLGFDRNDGAGFWWANSLNAFTRNVAVECDQHGFRFEAEKTEDFDPVLNVPWPDGSKKSVDIRTLPFIRFEDNEVHAQRRFGLNLGGIRGQVYGRFLSRQPESVGGDVDGVGPDRHHPFVIRNFKAWDSHWSFHAGSPSVLVQGMDLRDGQYGIWRSVMSLHKYERLQMSGLESASISFPTGRLAPAIEVRDGRPSFPALDPVDDLPPVTIATRAWTDEDAIHVRGTAVDGSRVAAVYLNGVPATATRRGFAEWRAVVPRTRLKDGTLRVWSKDSAGNVEKLAHVLKFPARRSN